MIKIKLKCAPLIMSMSMIMIMIMIMIIIMIVYLVFASLHTPLSSYKPNRSSPSPQNVATLLLVHCLEHFSLLYTRHYFHRKSKMQGKNKIFLLFDGN